MTDRLWGLAVHLFFYRGLKVLRDTPGCRHTAQAEEERGRLPMGTPPLVVTG